MREGSVLYILVLYIVIARTLAKYIYIKKIPPLQVKLQFLQGTSL